MFFHIHAFGVMTKDEGPGTKGVNAAFVIRRLSFGGSFAHLENLDKIRRPMRGDRVATSDSHCIAGLREPARQHSATLTGTSTLSTSTP
jgi:hypothetical protein